MHVVYIYLNIKLGKKIIYILNKNKKVNAQKVLV